MWNGTPRVSRCHGTGPVISGFGFPDPPFSISCLTDPLPKFPFLACKFIRKIWTCRNSMISANGHFSIASFTCFCLEVPFKHQTLLNYVEIDSPRLAKHHLCLHIHYLNHTLLVDLVHKNTTKTKRKNHDNNR